MTGIAWSGLTEMTQGKEKSFNLGQLDGEAALP
jgi:hypothetical protein